VDEARWAGVDIDPLTVALDYCALPGQAMVKTQGACYDHASVLFNDVPPYIVRDSKQGYSCKTRILVC
jgi:hypothetical protein